MPTPGLSTKSSKNDKKGRAMSQLEGNDVLRKRGSQEDLTKLLKALQVAEGRLIIAESENQQSLEVL